MCVAYLQCKVSIGECLAPYVMGGNEIHVWVLKIELVKYTHTYTGMADRQIRMCM